MDFTRGHAINTLLRGYVFKLSAAFWAVCLVVATIPMAQSRFWAGHWFYSLTKRLYCIALFAFAFALFIIFFNAQLHET